MEAWVDEWTASLDCHHCPTCRCTFNYGTSRVSKTVAEKLEVIAWNETHGDGIPARALKHFRDERGWIMSGSQIRQWWKKRSKYDRRGQHCAASQAESKTPALWARGGLEQSFLDALDEFTIVETA
ncbi:hypothetical protein GQ600_19871 [Phytophthora cactorum]|nr:hypothetical protein GQ600_19871 [Phytophthora cactorum]